MSYKNHPVVAVKKLNKSFADRAILRNIDLQVEQHELTVLIGPSGCGKTTLLRCLNMLEPFDDGLISIAGLSWRGQAALAGQNDHLRPKMYHVRQKVGMVFQSFNLFPHLNVLQNVMKAPVVAKGLSEREARQDAEKLLHKVGLAEHLKHYPSQLSGGQQQRAAIARALAMQPEVMLYDEPTSALDPGLTDEVLNVMKDLHREGMTQIVVTHEMRFARDVADKIAYLEAGEIIEIDRPDRIFAAPKDARTRQFLKKYL